MDSLEPLRSCKCGVKAYKESDLELFEKRSNGLYGRGNRCKKCRNRYGVISGHNKGANCRDRLGISRKDYLSIMVGYDKCEACGKKTKQGGLCYDHDHNTMQFRGRLCQSCNRGLGLIGDTLEAVNNIKDYLERHYGKYKNH